MGPGSSSAHLWGDSYSAATADRQVPARSRAGHADLTSAPGSGFCPAPSPPHLTVWPWQQVSPKRPPLPSPVTAVLGVSGDSSLPPLPQLPWTHLAFMPSGSRAQEVSIRTQNGPGADGLTGTGLSGWRQREVDALGLGHHLGSLTLGPEPALGRGMAACQAAPWRLPCMVVARTPPWPRAGQRAPVAHPPVTAQGFSEFLSFLGFF